MRLANLAKISCGVQLRASCGGLSCSPLLQRSPVGRGTLHKLHTLSLSGNGASASTRLPTVMEMQQPSLLVTDSRKLLHPRSRRNSFSASCGTCHQTLSIFKNETNETAAPHTSPFSFFVHSAARISATISIPQASAMSTDCCA